MSIEKTEEELVYDVGTDALWLYFRYRCQESRHRMYEHYITFKGRALKLGVELPDLPNDEELSEKFFTDLAHKVQIHIKVHKSHYMEQLYLAGVDAECLLQVLVCASQYFFETGKQKEDYDSSLTNKDLPNLIQRAKHLGVDLGDLEAELKDICENYMRYEFEQFKYLLDNSIRVSLKNKLCGPSSGCKRSKIDPTRVITDECWTISLVRLPDSSNAEHAFLVLEGKEGRKSKIWFADFVAKHWVDAVLPGTEDGKVRMEYHEAEGDPTTKLLFKCQKKMMEVRAGDRLLYSTWLIHKTTAEMLIKMIEGKQKKPPKYHALGNTSVLAASSATSRSNPTGHNCFTFAKMMLRDLNDPYIQLPEDDLATWIVSATSRYLVDNWEARRPWYKTSSFQLMLGFLGGVFVAFFLPKAFYPKDIK